jgi:hypothetical protein
MVVEWAMDGVSEFAEGGLGLYSCPFAGDAATKIALSLPYTCSKQSPNPKIRVGSGVLMKILADAEWFFFPACEVIV